MMCTCRSKDTLGVSPQVLLSFMPSKIKKKHRIKQNKRKRNKEKKLKVSMGEFLLHYRKKKTPADLTPLVFTFSTQVPSWWSQFLAYRDCPVSSSLPHPGSQLSHARCCFMFSSGTSAVVVSLTRLTVLPLISQTQRLSKAPFLPSSLPLFLHFPSCI